MSSIKALNTRNMHLIRLIFHMYCRYSLISPPFTEVTNRTCSIYTSCL